MPNYINSKGPFPCFSSLRTIKWVRLGMNNLGDIMDGAGLRRLRFERNTMLQLILSFSIFSSVLPCSLLEFPVTLDYASF